MTEAQWRANSELVSSLAWVAARTSQRKFRLYLCAGARAISHLFFDNASVHAVDVAERFADGLADDSELYFAQWAAECPTFGHEFDRKPGQMPEIAEIVQEMGAFAGAIVDWDNPQVEQAVRERLLAAAEIAYRCVSVNVLGVLEQVRNAFRVVDWPGPWLLHCIFGNPFCPAAIDPTWRSWNDCSLVKLARTIYDDRRWDLMPILGDALEDAGCDNANILAHCRGPGPHVRGCWVVDLILGKE